MADDELRDDPNAPWNIKNDPNAPWNVQYKEGKAPKDKPLSGTAESLAKSLYEPGVDYTKGADVNTRYNVSRAGTDEEASNYLKNRYGRDAVKKDPSGNWLVRQGGAWVPVFPRGMGEGVKSLGAEVAAKGPPLAAAVAGGAVGETLGGPAGGFAGATGGALLAGSIDEVAKRLQGFGNTDARSRLAEEALLAGAFQGAGPAWAVLKKPLFAGTSKVLSGLAGTTPESRALARSFEQYNVWPPIGTVAPGLRSFDYDRFLRNLIAKDPKQAGRIAALDDRVKQTLQRFGINGSELANAQLVIQDKASALSGQEGAEAVAAHMETAEGRVVEHLENFRRDEMANRMAAERKIRELEAFYTKTPMKDVGPVGGRMSDVFVQERRNFTETANAAYDYVHNMAEGAPVVPTGAIKAQARELASYLDPAIIPPQIKKWMADDAPGMTTIKEAHNYRTYLRELANTKGDVSPIGQRKGMILQMAASVDDAMTEAGDYAGESVAAALKEADAAYSKGVQVFNFPEVNKIVTDVRAGRMPNARVVADLLVNKDSAEATRQMWDLLPPELRADVVATDTARMFASASRLGKDGRRWLNADSLADALEERKELDFIYTPRYRKNLEDLAVTMKAFHGDVDITGLPDIEGRGTAEVMGRQARLLIERAVGARKALEEEKVGGMEEIRRLKSDRQDLQAVGASYFIDAKEERTLAGMNIAGGPNSPAWKTVQRYALIDMFKSAYERIPAKTKGYTFDSSALEKYMAKFTPAQQEALFGDQAHIDDLKYLISQADALFPEFGQPLGRSSTGASMAAANIMGHIPRKTALRAYTLSVFAGALADNKLLAQMLVGTLKSKPYTGRALMGYIVQTGAYSALQASGGQPQRPDQFKGLFGATPKDPTTSAPQMYGP